jgi:hypothetical protein
MINAYATINNPKMIIQENRDFLLLFLLNMSHSNKMKSKIYHIIGTVSKSDKKNRRKMQNRLLIRAT